MTLIIKQETFEGPLDVLLYLIEKNELDITTVALAEVTDQYLSYIEDLERQQLSEVSDFLVIAARLLVLKSRALLPGEVEEDDVEDDLAARLREYKHIKHLAGELEAGLGSARISWGKDPSRLEFAPQLVTDGVDLRGMQETFAKLLAHLPEPQPVRTETLDHHLTIEECTEQVQARLHAGPLPFAKLFSGLKSRLAMIVTFLAILELFKQRLLALHQQPELTLALR